MKAPQGPLTKFFKMKTKPFSLPKRLMYTSTERPTQRNGPMLITSPRCKLFVGLAMFIGLAAIVTRF